MAVHGELRCLGITPCVVRNNRAGQLMWAHLDGTGLFHLAYRLRGQVDWKQYSIGMASPLFSAVCRVLGQ